MTGKAINPSAASDITRECDELAAFLISKNDDYGNSALEPVRIFSKATAAEGLRVRIDDKLSRMLSGGEKRFDEDTLKDLAGYYILLRIAERREHDECAIEVPLCVIPGCGATAVRWEGGDPNSPRCEKHIDIEQKDDVKYLDGYKQPTCKHPRCKNPARVRGYCAVHYKEETT